MTSARGFVSQDAIDVQEDRSWVGGAMGASLSRMSNRSGDGRDGAGDIKSLHSVLQPSTVVT